MARSWVRQGLSLILAGVAYTTDLASPARDELREVLERMLRALDAPPPPSRPKSARGHQLRD